MFFANPVTALRRVRESLVPGGILNMVVWRRKIDNGMMHRAELVVDRYLDEPEDPEAPRCGPGPFSMANADTVTDVLLGAGFEGIARRGRTCPTRSARTSTRPSPSTWRSVPRPRCSAGGEAAWTRSGRRSPRICGRRCRTSWSTAAR